MWIEAYLRMIESNEMHQLEKKSSTYKMKHFLLLWFSGKLLFSSTALIAHLEREWIKRLFTDYTEGKIIIQCEIIIDFVYFAGAGTTEGGSGVKRQHWDSGERERYIRKTDRQTRRKIRQEKCENKWQCKEAEAKILDRKEKRQKETFWRNTALSEKKRKSTLSAPRWRLC